MKKTVLTYGTFDTLHYGHLRFLKRASAMGNRLIVGVSGDKFNLEKKGKLPVQPWDERVEALMMLNCVNAVFEERSWKQKRDDIKFYNADILVMGDDWKGKFDDLNDICKVVYLPRTPGISSTEIRNILRKEKKDVEKIGNGP